MGWKAVKEHYRIEHLVQIREGLLCVGSAYIHDIITISLEGGLTKEYPGPRDRGWTQNKDLVRYSDEMKADPAKLRELVLQPDTFATSLPVFTYSYPEFEIVEKKCEQYGWPNVTHDGEMMYENMFFQTRAEAVNAAIKSGESGGKSVMEHISDLKKQLTIAETRWMTIVNGLAALKEEKKSHA